MAAPADRYEPLPGLFGLPAFLIRKLSRRGRRVAAAIGVLLLAGAVAGAIVLVPRISETKRENAAAERQAQLEAAKRLRARLVAEQRPRRGRLAPAGPLVPLLERAITSDARARAASGELDNEARRTDCRRLGRDGGRVLLACTAITSEAESNEKVSGVVVGYSYRAAVDPASGGFAFCKTSGRPAVGFEARGLPEVELPRACGG